jgi:hypothetical protein
MQTYGPKKEFPARDNLELYLITCIRFFKILYVQYGCDGLYAYNAGEKQLLNNNIPDITYIYKYNVSIHVNNLFSELEDIASHRKERELAELKENYAKALEELYGLQWKILNRSRFNKESRSLLLFRRHYPQEGILYDPRKRLIQALHIRRMVIRQDITNDKSIDIALSCKE